MFSHSLFYVFIGGGLGASLRYGLSLVSTTSIMGFATSTLYANVIASGLAGFLLPIIRYQPENLLLKNLAIIGVCGGLSTFSTYLLDFFHLYEKGEWRNAFFLIFSHHIIAFVLLFLFYKLGLMLWSK